MQQYEGKAKDAETV